MQGNGLSSLYFEMFIILIVVGFSLVVVAREGGVGGGGGAGGTPIFVKTFHQNRCSPWDTPN